MDGSILTDDTWTVAGRTFSSRLIVGTGRYKDLEETGRAIEASGAEIVTVAVRRVKELTEWVDSGAYDRIRNGDYPRRGEEPPPSQEFEDAVEHYRERFARILDRAAGGVQDLGRRLGSWLDRFQNSGTGSETDPEEPDEPEEEDEDLP